MRLLDEASCSRDELYILHAGSKPIVALASWSSAQASPFVLATASGDRDWTGSKWVTYSADVSDVDACNPDAPLTNAEDGRPVSDIDVTLSRSGFGPPNYFICPLHGRA